MMNVCDKVKLFIILLFMACLILVSVNSISATDVTGNTFTDLNNTINKSDDISLTKDIVCNTTEANNFKEGINVTKNLTINGNGFAIDGNNSVRIFQITNSSAVLTLKDITLKNGYTTGYGGAIYNTGNVNLILQNNIIFENNIADGIGGAIYSASGLVNIISTNGTVTFRNNKANSEGSIGGAIGATMNVTINSFGNILFDNNTADIMGGAIYSFSGLVNIISTNGTVTFRNNKANSGIGGAIGATMNMSINSFGNILFDNNTAGINGGAIFLGGLVNITSANGDITFRNNKANSYAGGAISTNNDVVINSFGNILFDNNTAGSNGGAIYSGGLLNITSTDGYLSFINNKGNSGDGGAICAKNKVTIIAKNNIEFKNNYANSTNESDLGGGAISAYNYDGSSTYTYYNVILTSKNGNIIFKNNNATKNGGAILAGNITINTENNIFSNNTTSDGLVNITTNGAVTFTNNKAKSGDGGAIHTGLGYVIINSFGDILFDNNTVNSKGGAIYSFSGLVNIISTNGTITFRNNKVIDGGGAIYAGKDVIINAFSNILFTNNTVGSWGGAIDSANGLVNITSTNGDITFNNNKAKNGGAIYTLNKVIINAIGNVLFTNNTAEGNGGAIYTTDDLVNITSTDGEISFTNNKANSGNGGAIRASGNVIINAFSNILFENNTAIYSGGAIYSRNININNAVFYGNNATNGKCIYLTDGTDSSFENCFWGLNYKNQQAIKEAELIYNKSSSSDVAPDYWLLLNIIPSQNIICDRNNTFRLAFNQKTDGKQIININPITANILVRLTEDNNNVPNYAKGYFNYTTNQTGTYTINIHNIYNNEKSTSFMFKVDNSAFSTLAGIIETNTTLNLEKDYDYYKEIDQKYANGISITRNTTINGNGHTLNAKNLANIFQVQDGVTLTLKDINLNNAITYCIVNYGVLNLTNVKSNKPIYNKGVISSGVIFYVGGRPLTTYDSFIVTLKTVDGISIKSGSLIFSDDQGHTYKTYMYDDTNRFYVCYIPVGVTGYVTFNNVVLSKYPALVSKGCLNITSYPKKVVSNTKTMKNIFNDITTKVVKTTPQKIMGKNIPVLTPVLKNVSHNIKTNVQSLFKFSNTFLRA